ncbi:hypothetical protein Hbl1158_04525 [Halobaculum sp. CBA1158]|uniref:DUF7562 family protein n=1 Tax=Halobaculum sp. CBA1158 TaxID=2904243 RepID=UPI001F2F79F7|nr:hypothetical protein [Halobaculum sp. CBA1158]UIP00632.1 hypothetical protein Hbl1158_04525 [Halobaculum sp. CBA1158]
MWGSRRDRDRSTVVCIACGESLSREDAREYDKEGDRWSRRDKEFEYLCKGCYRGLSHQPRDDLEALLSEVEAAAGGDSQEAYVRAYQREVQRRYGDPDAEPDADAEDADGRGD